jgi:MGT family glycosyltransferase
MLGLPAVTFSTTFVMKPGSDFEQMFMTSENAGKMAATWDYVRRSVDELHAVHGVPPLRLSDMFSPGEPANIVPLIRQFQPDADSLDERYLFTGPSIRGGGADHGFPLDHLDGGPGLYISLGTAISRGSGSRFTEICFDAFGGTDWRVVLSAGAGTDLASLPAPPANFLVRGYVPQLDVLSRAQVFVTHGGVNSVMEAMWYGVPLVAIPHTIEQLMFADRAAQLGLGTRLDPAEVTAATLRAAADAIAADPGYRTRLAGISAAARQAGGHQRAADAIQQSASRFRKSSQPSLAI